MLWLTAIIVLAAVAAVGWRRGGKADRPSASLPSLRVEQLTDFPGEESWPNVSPDGRWMLYVSRDSGNEDIHLLAVGGRSSINLTLDSSEDDSNPAFSPDGEAIVFRSERLGGGLFLMDRTGESVRRLTDGGDDPAWSPDGTQVVYASEGVVDPRDRTQGSQLYVLDVESGERRLIPVPDALQPRWSPDGRHIVYWAAPAGQPDVYTIRADGGEPVKVTDDPALDWSPVWSPDGRFLYFASDRSGSMNLWRVPTDPDTGAASGPLESLSVPSPWVGQIALSADGRRIVYQTRASPPRLERARDHERLRVEGDLWMATLE